MSDGRGLQYVAFSFMVAFMILASPVGGEAQIPGQSLACTAENVTGTADGSAGYTYFDGGTEYYAIETQVTWDCNDGRSSVCAVCSTASYAVGIAEAGPFVGFTRVGTQKSHTAAACNSTGNEEAFYWNISPITVGTWYKLTFSAAAIDPETLQCRDPETCVCYVVYGTIVFEG